MTGRAARAWGGRVGVDPSGLVDRRQAVPVDCALAA